MSIDAPRRAAAMTRQRSFGLIAIIVMAIGVATTTAIFAVVDAVLLRPLPYPDSERLVSIREMRGAEFAGRTSPGRLEDWRQRTRTLDAIAGVYVDNFSMEIAGAPARLSGAVVSPGFFQVIGSAPVAGRTFLLEEEQAGGPRAAVISERLSRRMRVNTGSVMRLGPDVYTVVGVVAASVAVPLPATEVWIAKQARPELLRVRRARNYNVIARVRAGASPAQVTSDLDAIQRDLGRLYPATDADLRIEVTPLKDRIVGGSPSTLWPLLGAAVLTLIVACANITCLLIAGMPLRESDMRTRVALGARWRHLWRLLIQEAVIVGGVGAIVGAALAGVGLILLRRELADFPRLSELTWHLDTTAGVLLQFVLMTVIFAAVPGIWMRRRLARAVAPVRAIATAHRTSRALLVFQFALATLLVASAMVLTNALLRQQRMSLGFDVTNLTSLRVSASSNEGSPVQFATRQIRISDALGRIPGVEHVAASADMPGVDAVTSQPFRLLATDVADTALVRPITGSYFSALRIVLEKGTSCVDSANPSAPAVVIVNHAFVHRFLAGRDPLGMAVDVAGYGGNPNGLPIVGIAADVREQGYASDIEPIVYVCGPMRFWAEPYYLVRSAVPADSMVTALRAAAAAAEPSRAVFAAAPVSDVLADTLARPRFQAGLMGAFAVVALILAAAGLYGVLAYVVALRRAEIGVRLAIGARRADVATHVIGDAVRWAAAGLVIGLALVGTATPLLSRAVYDHRSTDAGAVALTAAVLLVAAVCASAAPAVRASRVNPAELMRE